ncbi:MAG: META domain-containing protein [Candidatus Electrothrix sp.]
MEPRKIVTLLTAVLCLFVTGCALIGQGGTPTVLDNTSWVLERLHGQPVIQGHRLTLNFEKNKINGSTGCNSYSGSYTGKDDGAWHMEEISTTEMACSPSQVMVQEEQFFNTLKTAAAYEIINEKLTLKNGAGQTLAVFIAPVQGLQGTSWLVTAYNNDADLTSILPGSTVTVTFGTDSRVSGSAGCNRYFGTYTSTVAQRNINIAQVGRTTMLCQPADAMVQEGNFITALKAATSYQIAGQHLTLSKADGSLAVTLKRN